MSPRNYPAAVGYIINLIMGGVVAFGFLPQDTAHIVATAVVGLTSVVVAFMVHPFNLAAASGAFATFLVGLSAFGLHLTDAQTASVVAIFGFIAAIVTHSLASPLSAVKEGTTGNERDSRGLRGRAVAR